MRRALVIAGCGLGLAVPVSAAAAGGGVPPVQGGIGASAPGGVVTYVALPAGRTTLIQRVRRTSGAVDRWQRLTGSFGVPGAAMDGSTTGLSADGRTLVLAETLRTYPPRSTRLLVLDPGTLRIRDRITIGGYASVDAISPDGRWLYLVRYTDPIRDTTRYEVRAYDLAAGRLIPQPVVDPKKPDERMGGMPMTRTLSADGRWAYTLYDAKEPFIHALDTTGRTAVCIDLPQLTGTDVSTVHLALGPGHLTLTRSDKPVALVDTATFAVTRPAAAVSAPAPRATPAAKSGGSILPWALVAIPLAAALAFVLARRAHTEPTLNSPKGV
jgi:hypothetical protein